MTTISMVSLVWAVLAGMIVQGLIQFTFSRFGELRQLRLLKSQVKVLQEKVTMLESSHQDAPIPIWLKDKFGIMLALNPAYEKTFLFPIGKTRDDYLHRSDYDIWPDDIAAEYIKNDKMVQRTMDVWIGYENVIDQQGNKVQWRIIKYPRTANGVLIGIAGIAVPHE